MSKYTYTYDYPRPCVTTDVVLFHHYTRSVLLVTRKNDPCRGMFALPGGYINMDETLIDGAVRECKEETNIDICPDYIGSNYVVMDSPNRDSRGRVITFGFLYPVSDKDLKSACAGDDAKHLDLVGLDKIFYNEVNLAFDHKEIIMRLIQNVG